MKRWFPPLLLGALLALPATPASAAPVAAFIVGVVGLTGTAATIATFVLTTALSIGASALMSTLTKPSTPSQERQASVTTLQLGEVAREAAFGRVCSAGSLLWAFNFGGKYGTDWECLVVALADHEIDAIEGYYVSDQYYAYTGDGGQGAFSNCLDLEFINGSAVTDPLPVRFTAYTDWAATDVLRGVAHIWIAYKYDDKIWPQGRPSFKWVFRGKKCYDPRRDSTVSGGAGLQRWADPTTWTWSENAQVCRYNWVRGVFACDQVGRPDQLLVGRGLSATEAPPENIIAYANLCDEPVPLRAGGTEPRYRVGGVIRADETFDTTEQMFAAAMGGVQTQPSGGVEIEPGYAKAAVVEITDGDLIVGEPVTYDEFLQGPERRNTVIPRYVEPAQVWQDHAAPVRRSLADVAQDGGQLDDPLTLSLVTSGTQAQRCGEIKRRLNRLERRATITVGPELSALEDGDWIAWTSDRFFGGGRVVFRVEQWGLNEKWQNTLALREIAASVYSWTAANDELIPGTPPPPEQPRLAALALTGVAIAPVQLIGPGGVTTPAVRAFWDAPVDAACFGVRLEVRLQGQAEVAPTTWSRPNDGYMVSTNGVAGSANLQVRLVPLADPSRDTTASAWIDITAGAMAAALAKAVPWDGVTGPGKPEDGADVTGNHTAGGIKGQGPWATEPTPVNVVLQPGVNLVYDGAFRLSGARWTLGPNWEFSPTDGTGLALMGANGTSVSTSDNFNVKPNTTYTIQAEVLAYGIVSGAVMANVQWHDAGGAVISQSNGLYWGNGGFTDWRRQATQVTSPANAAYGRARIYTSSVVWATSLSAAVFRRVKVAAETSASPFSDDATNGAVYNDGRDINSLRPAQAGADKTASNTAAAILNQGQLATSTLTTTQVDNRNVPVGANALINDLFSNGTYGWETGGDGSTGKTFDKGLNYPGYGGQRNVAYCHVVGAVAANAWFWGLYSSGAVGALSSRPRFALPVVAGDLVYIRCLMAYHRCKGVLRVRWMDGAGNNILEQDIVPNLASGDAGGPNGANGDPGNFGEVWGYFTAPANARYAALLTYAQVLTATNDPFLFVAEPMLAKAPAGQNTSVKLPYLPGTVDRYADQTGINQSASIAGQGALATKNQAASADLAVGIGGNLLFGADHQLDPALIYQIGWNPSNASYTIQRASDYYGGSWSLADRSTFTLSQLDNTTDGGSGFNIIDVYLYRPDGVGGFTNKWSVQPGKWYEFSAYFTSWAQVNCYCGIAWFDKNWAQLYGEVGASVAGNTGNGRDMGADYQRAFVRKQAPPGAVMAMPFIRKSNYPGGSWMMWTHPKFCETVANATEISPWSPSVWSVGVYQSSRGRIINANGLPINGMTSYGWVINPTAPLSSPSSTSINVAPFTLYLPGYSLSVSSQPINGLAPNTAYSVYWDLQASTFVAISSGTQPYSTSPDRYIALGVQTTQQASGGWSPPSPPVGGGGGGGGGICVLADSHMPNRIRAGAVQAGTALTVLKRDGSGHEPEVCYSNRPGAQPCVMLTLANGAQVGCTVKTPIEQRDGSAIFAQHALGAEAAYLVDGVFGWAEIVAVEPIGVRPIAQITVGNRSYAAGVKPGAFVFTHNQSQIP